MPRFSIRSQKKLETCHVDLQDIMNEVIKHLDITILCGHRSKGAQNAAYYEKRSQLRWPKSCHNTCPSMAVDVAPFPLNWDDLARFVEMAKLVFKVADEKGIKIEWGGSWKTFKDFPHFELVTEAKNEKI